MSFTNEKIVEEKTCRQCSSVFHVTDKDLKFYEKVSPVFAWEKYSIPTPTMCPVCRQQRRLAFRNERSLYKRIDDSNWKQLISIYSPDKPYKVFNTDTWWSDSWNPLDYGRDYDFSQSFTDQFDALMKDVPHLDRYVLHSTESEYTNWAANIKKCYLCFNVDALEECYYCYTSNDLNKSFDCSYVKKSENCFGSCNLLNCFWLFDSDHSEDCRNSHFISSCQNCEFCFLCVNQVGKKHCIRNKQYTKEKYFEEIKKISEHQSRDELKKELEVMKSALPRKSSYTVNVENTTGDYITDIQNSHNIFDSNNIEDCKYCWYIYYSKDCMDYDIFGYNSELIYESTMAGDWLYKSAFCFGNWDQSRDVYYSALMSACKNCFWCFWLKNQQYCIFNKQYTKEQYEQLVPKIIEHMEKHWEWWEFFDPRLAPCDYNESVAQDFHVLDQDLAHKKWFKWSNYDSPEPDVTKIIPWEKLPNDIKDIPDDILNWAIECEDTKRLFRIIKSELEFYRKHNLPIPKRHPNRRHLDRMKLRNPRKLYERNCDKCEKDIQTTYAPERKETVYCEECYNKEIY